MWISFLLALSLAGLLEADTSYLSPIQASNLHLNERAEYKFHIRTTVTLPRHYKFFIEFPKEFETVQTTGCQILYNGAYTDCSVSLMDSTAYFDLELSLQAMSKFTVILQGVKNPELEMITSPFNLYVRKPDDIQNYAQNKVFGYLTYDRRFILAEAIYGEFQEDFELFDPVVQEMNSYALRLNLSENIDSGTWFEITLPDQWSKVSGIDSDCDMLTYYDSQEPLKGTFFCETVGQKVMVKGLNQNLLANDVNQGNITIIVANVKNPTTVMHQGDENFFVRVLEQGTQRVFAIYRVPTPTIMIGDITDIGFSKVNSYSKTVKGNTVLYNLAFRLNHELPEGGRIDISLSYGTFVSNSYTGCHITEDVPARVDGTYPGCVASGQQIVMSNMSRITDNSLITLQIGVNLSTSAFNDKITITSSFDGVDIDYGIQNVLYSVDFKYKKFNSYAITLNTKTFKTSSQAAGFEFNIDFQPLIDLPSTSTITINLPPDFVVSNTLNCAIGANDQSCTGSNPVTFALTNNALYTATTTIKLSGITMPQTSSNIINTYEVCVEAVQSSEVDEVYVGCQIVELQPDTLTTGTLQSDFGADSYFSPFTVSYSSSDLIIRDNMMLQVDLNIFNTAANTNGFDLDLGVGSNLACVFSATLTNPTCSVTSAPNSQSDAKAYIQFMNLETVNSSTRTIKFVIKSPSLTNPAGGFTSPANYNYQVKLGYLESNVFKVMKQTATATISFSSVATTFSNLNLNARSNTEIGQYTMIELQNTDTPAVTSATNEKLVIILPAGWDVSNVDIVLVDDDRLDSYVLYQNNYAPMIIATDAVGGHIDFNSSQKIRISPLMNPSPVGTGTSASFQLGLISTAGVVRIFGSTQNTLEASIPAEIDDGYLTLNISEKRFPAAHYMFTVTLLHDLPDDGTIQVYFPQSNFSDFSKFGCDLDYQGYTDEPECAYENNVITLSGLDKIQAGTKITVTVKWVPNPNAEQVSGFTLTTYNSAGNAIDKESSFTAFYQTTFQAGEIIVSDIDLDPSTKNAENADFKISFISSHILPKSTYLQIDIPDDFPKLPSSTCYLNFQLQSCSISGTLISVTIAEDIQPSTRIELTANAVFIVPNVDQTGTFQIQASYNGILIDQTDQQEQSSETFETDPEAGQLVVEEIQMRPVNQGEKSTYRFELYSPDIIKTTDRLIIWFPDTFDNSLTTLTSDIDCWGEPNEFVGGTLNCKLEEFRKLVITGHKQLDATLPFLINIAGVINPKTGNLGNFRFAIENEEEIATHYSVRVGNMWVSQSPNYMRVRDIRPALPYARILNTFIFEFTPYSDIPSSIDQGEIWIDFPPEFKLKNLGYNLGWEYSCTTRLIDHYLENASNWNENVTCINYESNRIVITGGIEVEAAEFRSIEISISEVPGPIFTTQTQPFVIRTVNNNLRRVIDKTTTLLNYPLTLTLPLSGENLQVNEGMPITVRKGTSSKLYKIETESDEHPMRVFLKVSGSIPKIPSATFYPDYVLLWNTSHKYKEFRVGVPIDAVPGTYSLEWTKTGDDYEKDIQGDEIYSPIPTTTVIVTDEKSEIEISEVSNVVAPGRGFHISVTLEHPPNSQVYIIPSIISNISQGITFEPNSLEFTHGQYQQSFLIRAEEDAVLGLYEIEFELAGEDETAFNKPGNRFFEIVGRDNVAPAFEQLSYSATRRTVNISVRTDEAATMYYQLELRNTPVPTPSELLEYGTMNQACWVNVFNKFVDVTFTIEDLAAETKYVLFAVLEDRSGNMSPVRRLDIVTQKDFNSAKFAVDFLEYNPDSLNQDDGLEDFIKPEFAKALSVSTSRLNIYSILTVQRRLQTENTEDENDLDLSDMSNKAVIIELANDKYSDMVSPVEAALALTLIDLNQFLSRFELTAINISNRFEMTNQQPEWVKAANVWSVSGTSITVAGQLDSPGYLHIVVLDLDSPEPSAQQIVWGLDGENRPSRHASSYYDGTSNLGYATYTGLVEQTKYEVYAAATNDYPGNNKMVAVEKFDFKGVRTDISCLDCDKYLVVDDESSAYLMLVWILTVLVQ